MQVTVVVASKGRPEVLTGLLQALVKQSVPPAQVVLAVTCDEDLPQLGPSILVNLGTPGSAVQRNRGLMMASPESDLVAFLDDDYRPARDAVEGMIRLFSRHPDVVGATGALVADGINSPGLSEQEAKKLLGAYDQTAFSQSIATHDLDGLYGCNMVFRHSALSGILFDEALPLYGWQEDFDFAARLKARGRIVGSNAFTGVHLGVKSARTSGRRFGYSQIANPVYLWRKGTMKTSYALKLMATNLAANHLRAVWPEPWVDRLGRSRGNWEALLDLVRGRLHPSRINDFL